MSDQKSPLRRRITPSIPYILNVEDANGDKFSYSFRVSYDFNAFSDIERLTGLSMLTNMGEIFDNPTVTTLTVCLWAGIRYNHSEWAGEDGLETLRANMSITEAKNALKACIDAFLAQLPKAQQEILRKRMEAVAAGEDPGPLAQAQTATSA